MPHIEIKYSTDLALDCKRIFNAIEKNLNEIDSSADECKGRAYPAKTYHHSHILISVHLLKKAHRDKAFSKQLTENLVATIRKNIPFDCFLSFELSYRDEHYVTLHHTQ